jgi:hypothetical protein
MSKSESTPGEDAWIEKYRAAVNQEADAKPRGRIAVTAKRALVSAASGLGKIAALIFGRRKAGKTAEITSASGGRRGNAGVQGEVKRADKRKAG